VRISVPKEVFDGEKRVAATPQTVERYIAMGHEVAIESTAGLAAGFDDDAYRAAGAVITDTTESTWAGAAVVLKVRAPQDHPTLGRHESQLLEEGATLISFLQPATNDALNQQLADTKATALAIDTVPRITRAQKMDALSATANLIGYKAVITAADHFGGFFAPQFTAAGRLDPAKVLVIGAGVAGLAATSTAKELGALVRAFDTREAAREQVESVGGEFLTVELEESGDGGGGYAKQMSEAFLEAEYALFREQAKEVDIVITTALIPGRPAPKLWHADMVGMMKRGSIVIDLAGEQGGNCELTRPGEAYTTEGGVTIIGWTDLPSRMATTASRLFSNVVANLFDHMGGENFAVDMEDEVVRAMTVCHEGALTWPPPPPPEPTPAPAPTAKETEAKTQPATQLAEATAAPKKSSGFLTALIGLALAGLWVWLRYSAGDPSTVDDASREAALKLARHMTVFVLACFVGWHVIWTVTPALHTPLMSVTNAISGIIIIGGLVLGDHHAESTADKVALGLGTAAVLLAMINIAGGFLVTHRMLKMFRRGPA
jgi:NAD(P) transhydrogenase subunit alpha